MNQFVRSQYTVLITFWFVASLKSDLGTGTIGRRVDWSPQVGNQAWFVRTHLEILSHHLCFPVSQ